MNVKSIKKGFTLTELIIVIVIIGILAGVLIPTFINVVNKANRAADISLIRNLNEALTLDKYDKGEHKNMTQALEAAEEYGFNVAKISAKVSKNEILWDSKNDVFCYLNNGEIEYYPQSVPQGKKIVISENVNLDERHLLWIIDDDVPSDSKYSVYLYVDSDELRPTINVKDVGFDAGRANVGTVNYTGTKGHTVVIRTNSVKTSVVITAANDTVHHYDVAGSINIVKVASNSYHEYGVVGFMEIAKGRVALETGSIVNRVHIKTSEIVNEQTSAVETKFDEIIVSIEKTVAKPTFSRDDVEIDETKGTLVVALQAGTEEITDETELDYVWLTKQGIYEQIKVSETKEEAGNVWVDQLSGSTTEEQQKVAKTKDAAFEIANNITRNTLGQVEATVTLNQGQENEATYNVSLDEDRNLVVTDTLDPSSPVADETVISNVSAEAIESTGLTETEKNAAKEAAIVVANQTTCKHLNTSYVSNGESGHRQVCDDCGKVLIEHELHVFESEDVPPCIKCEYAGNIIKIKVNDTGTENPQSISETMSLSAAIQQYNNYDGEGKDFIIELDDGEYIMTPSNATNDGIIIDQSGVNKGHNLTIKAKNMPTSVNDNFNVIIKSANVGNSYLTTTSAFFQVNGCSSTNGGGIITFTGIKFDFTTSGALSGTDYKFGNNRLAAVFLMAGATNRYAHDVTMKLCQFHGPNGKLASAVNSTEHNSNPTRITIRDCKGDGMNSWFNGYQSQYGTLEDNFGLKLINLESDHFLIVANPQSGGDVIIDNVNGSFLTVPGDTLLERWLLKFIVNVNLTINNCNWDLIGNSPDDGSKSKDSCGVIIFVGSSYTAHATISDFVVTRSGLTNKTTSQFPDIRLKDGASLSINGNPAFSNEFTSPYTVTQ